MARTRRRARSIAIWLAVGMCYPAMWGNAADTTSASPPQTTVRADVFSGIIDYLNGPAAPGPLTPVGKALYDIGVTPELYWAGITLFNPSMGQQPGHGEQINILAMGFDADLNKMFGLKGSSIHFQYLWVPPPHNNGDIFGVYGGDSLIGQTGPYIPLTSHLTQLTWGQKLLDDQLEAAVGIDNAGNYFGIPLCNQQFLCQSATMQNSVGMNPPPYSNYSARLAYHFTPEWSAQFGFWRSNSAFPFTTGWEGWDGTVTTTDGITIDSPNSNLFLVNLVHEVDAKANLYPYRYEVMLYYNDALQTNPATGTVHSGTSGMYIGGRQSVWRASDQPLSTSVSLYTSLYTTFDQENDFGFGTQLDAGVILQGPFDRRPLDSYSLKFIWNHLTPAMQTHLIEFNTGTYTVGPDQYAVGVDANLLLAGTVVLQPWVNYVWNVNTFQSPVYSGNPKDGWAVGCNFVVLLDKMLGLSPSAK